MIRPLALALCLGLVGCQGPQPYVAESTPIPPAPANVGQGPDMSAYPAAPLDFSRYQHWSWRSPPAGTASVTPESLQEMVSGALDQRGLRPAPGGSRGDVQVTADARLETRTRQVYDSYGTYYGQGLYGRGYGLGGQVPLARSYEEQVMLVRIALFDAATGRQVWSNQAEARSSGSQAERADAMREAVHRALDDYPPR
ncbi:DUF4136 domain-containing protein [Stutzerimonas nosocomialis]|uniref:DUF4136 domain-containing protein n=1 Tax=Stutzerimonas nosocomialis TaxID=1056496 RepID=UPI001107EF0F|nr:DUF4136 domain-containing protein [Stutzerimonas nosocomialis]TLX55988.1 DUF4136 domain-containing protein [Stutzerimonas nosocomialis]